jgi:phosphoribosylformimino-5-aminoimidazole carboxamide ribotide isomerase
MLIPSIDLMGGKIVQLVGGEQAALQFDQFDEWIARFSASPVTQVIDLDAAKRQGSNAELVEQLCSRLSCQVGGGIRTVERALELLGLGARAVIIGSSLVKDGQVDVSFAQSLDAVIDPRRLIFAVDSRGGKVAVAGWREATPLTAAEMMRALDPYCGAFLYTHIDTEGQMTGFPVEVLPELQAATTRRLIVAGGIRTREEVDALDALGIDAVVGMAVYTGAIKV